jgi:hypothetical protein
MDWQIQSWIKADFYPFSIAVLTVNKRQRIPKGQAKMDNPEKLATECTQDEEKQNKNTTQYVLDTTICKQSQIHVT